LFDYFNGEIDLKSAIDLIKRNTKQYAKRQVTWFKKDGEFQWIEAEKIDPSQIN
jgi:tRNA dimethylallyltransferase